MQTIAQIHQILVQRLHGTITGPVVESQEYDERTGKQYRVFTWEVSNGTYVEKDLPHGWLVDIAPNNFNKAKLTLKISRKRKTDDTYEDGFFTEQVKTIGNVDLTPAIFRRFVTTKETTNRLDLAKENVSEIPAVPALTGTQTQIEHKKIDDQNYDEIVTEEVLDVNATTLEGEQTGTWGVEGTSKQLVVDGTSTPSGFGIKQAEVSPIGNGLSTQVVETYPASTGGIVHKLEGQETDELTGVIIDIDKYLVDAALAKTIAAGLRVGDGYTEIQPLDKWHSILISSKLNGTPAGQTWKESGNISMPDQLTTAGVIWDLINDTSADAIGVNNISTIESEGWQWSAHAEAVIVASVIGRPYTLVSNGFKGMAEITVTRTFHKGPPTTTITATAFKPVYGVITITGEAANTLRRTVSAGIGDTQTRVGASTKRSRDSKLLIHQFGPIVHNGITLTHSGDPSTFTGESNAASGSTPGGSSYPAAVASLTVTGAAELNIPVSSTPLTSGATYIVHVEVKPWRFGYWMREVYTAKVP